jgi:hypothetical protein
MIRICGAAQLRRRMLLGGAAQFRRLAGGI